MPKKDKSNVLRMRRQTVARHLRVLEEQIRIWTREIPEFPKPGAYMMYDWNAVQAWADSPGAAELPGLKRWHENRDTFVAPGQMGAREVTDEYGISSSTFWNWQRHEAFPQPANVAPLTWPGKEVYEWVQEHGRKRASYWKGQGIEALSVRGIAKLLGVSPGRAERQTQIEGFPSALHGSDDSLWDERKVKDWAVEHLGFKK